MEPNPFVSPKNRMPKKMMEERFKEAMNAPNEDGAIIKMKENEIMPVYIFTNDLTLAGAPVNLMAAISYQFGDKTITLNGRMRFEETGRKIVFTGKEELAYTPENYSGMKQEIARLNAQLTQGFSQKPTELEFAVDEDIDSIMKKMNDSNKFLIGIKSLIAR